MVFVGAIVAALLGLMIIFSPLVMLMAERLTGEPIPLVAGYITYGFGILVFFGFVLVMHVILPGRSISARRLWPGVLVTTVLWLLAAGGFTAVPELHADLHGDLRHARGGDHHPDVPLSHRGDDYIRSGSERGAAPACAAPRAGAPWPSD